MPTQLPLPLNDPKPPVRVAVKIQRVVGAEGRAIFKATLPVGVLFEKSLDRARLETERLALEEKYRALIEKLKKLRAAMKTGSVLHYWEFGDAIARFEAETDRSIVFVDKLNAHLERDVGMSDARLWVCETLRKRFPDASKIDPRQTISAYQRANFDSARLPKIARRPGRPRKKK